MSSSIMAATVTSAAAVGKGARRACTDLDPTRQLANLHHGGSTQATDIDETTPTQRASLTELTHKFTPNLVVLLTVAAYFLSELLANSAAQKRSAQIEIRLADTLDQVTIAVRSRTRL